MRQEKNINLDEIMYNEDQSFKPLTASNGNVDGNLSFFRDTYMEAEREYFESLLADEKFKNEFLSYINCDSDILFRLAIRIHEKIEYGTLETEEDIEIMKLMTPEEKDCYHMENLERAEGMMCLLLAATRDKVRILELIRTPEYGRSL